MTEGHIHSSRSLQRRALWIALFLNGGFLGVEVVGGIVFNSLALLADAAHMLSDVVGLVIALYAQSLMERPPSSRHTYGFQRSEVLGALANGITLVGVVIWILYEAAGRISDPEPIGGRGVILVAGVGLVINLFSARVLGRAQGESLNMRGAFIHMAADAAGSVAAITAGVAAALWQAHWADPVASVAIALLILWATWKLLRDTVQVLMEAAPRGMDAAEIESALTGSDGIESVHHLHLWNLASDVPAVSAHVVLTHDQSLHEAQERGDGLRTMLRERFGIDHATLELECHPCAEERRETH